MRKLQLASVFFLLLGLNAVAQITGPGTGGGGGALPTGIQGCALVNANGSTTYSTSCPQVDVTQFSGDLCAALNTASSGSTVAQVYDTRAYTTSQTCTPTETANTFLNMKKGSVVLIGDAPLKLGASTRSTGPQLSGTLTSCGYITAGTAAAGLTCSAAWVVPNMIYLIGQNQIASVITADSSNWVTRSGTISAATVSGSGNQCTQSGHTCYVHMTFGSVSPAPVWQELMQVQSNTSSSVSTMTGTSGVVTLVTTSSLGTATGTKVVISGTTNYNGTWVLTGATNSTSTYTFAKAGNTATETSGTVVGPDSNSGMFATCKHNLPSQNGGCDAANTGTPDATHADFYNNAALATSNGGTAIFGVPLIALGYDAVSAAIILGQGDLPFSEGNDVFNLTLDCSAIADCIAMQNVVSQDTTVIAAVSVHNAPFASFDSHAGGGSGYSNAEYRGLYATHPNDTCVYGTTNFYWGNNKAATIDHLESVNKGCVGNYGGYDPAGLGLPLAGIMIDGGSAGNTIVGIHTETSRIGILIAPNQPSIGPRVTGFKGHSSLTDCIRVSNNFGTNTSGVALQDIDNGAGAGCTNIVVDEINSNTVTAALNATLENYTIDNNGYVFTNAVANASPNPLTNGLDYYNGTFCYYVAGVQTACLNMTNLSLPANGTNPGEIDWGGNTTNPTCGANLFCELGPPAATFTRYGIQWPSTPPTAGQVASFGTPDVTTHISAVTFGAASGGIAFPQTVSGTTVTNAVPYLSNTTTLTGNGTLKTDANGATYQKTNAIGNCGSSQTVDPGNGDFQTTTLSAASCAISFTQPTLGSTILRLKVTQAAGGNDVLTWTACSLGVSGVCWPGVIPVMTATANAVDWYSCLLDGTNAFCTTGQNFK